MIRVWLTWLELAFIQENSLMMMGFLQDLEVIESLSSKHTQLAAAEPNNTVNLSRVQTQVEPMPSSFVESCG